MPAGFEVCHDNWPAVNFFMEFPLLRYHLMGQLGGLDYLQLQTPLFVQFRQPKRRQAILRQLRFLEMGVIAGYNEKHTHG